MLGRPGCEWASRVGMGQHARVCVRRFERLEKTCKMSVIRPTCQWRRTAHEQARKARKPNGRIGRVHTHTEGLRRVAKACRHTGAHQNTSKRLHKAKLIWYNFVQNRVGQPERLETQTDTSDACSRVQRAARTRESLQTNQNALEYLETAV